MTSAVVAYTEELLRTRARLDTITTAVAPYSMEYNPPPPAVAIQLVP